MVATHADRVVEGEASCPYSVDRMVVVRDSIQRGEEEQQKSERQRLLHEEDGWEGEVRCSCEDMCNHHQGNKQEHRSAR